MAGWQIDMTRLTQALEAYARIGATPQGGVHRPAFSAADLAARERLAADWAALGLRVERDAAANLFGWWDGELPGPAIWMGSHLDTVANGGRFDGALGVLAATEVVRTLRAAGWRPRHPLAVVNFTSEEPNVFGRSCVGSRAVAGRLELEELQLTAPDGTTLAEALRRAGGAPQAIQQAVVAPHRVGAYLELHVEQGPYLYEAGIPVGVVTAMTGLVRLACTLAGEANHSGTTPMHRRRDALAGAGELILAVEAAARSAGPPAVATVGRLQVQPNASNVVPAVAQLVVELRHPQDEQLQALQEQVEQAAAEIARRRGLQLELRRLGYTPPTPADPRLRELFARVLATRGVAYRELPSMAVHDASHVARVAPVGMLFVASRDGKSHCPEEWSSPHDIAAAAQALLDAVVELDRSLATTAG